MTNTHRYCHPSVSMGDWCPEPLGYQNPRVLKPQVPHTSGAGLARNLHASSRTPKPTLDYPSYLAWCERYENRLDAAWFRD